MQVVKLGSDRKIKVNVEMYGENYSHHIQPIAFDDGSNPGSFQVTLDGKLDGFVLPSGKRTENAFSLGNCQWEVCGDTEAHLATLRKYLVEDFADEETRTLA